MPSPTPAIDCRGARCRASRRRTSRPIGSSCIPTFAKEHGADEAMQPYVGPLSASLGHLQQATTWLMQNAMQRPDNAGAAATDFMHLFGLVAFGYMWARMAKVSLDKIAAGGATPY